jgi:hypothetical protein
MNLTKEGVYHVFKEEFLLFICIFKRFNIFPNELIYYLFSLYENIILPKLFVDIDSFIFNNNLYTYKTEKINKNASRFVKTNWFCPLNEIVSLGRWGTSTYIVTNKQILFDNCQIVSIKSIPDNISARYSNKYILLHTTDGLYVQGYENKSGELGLGDTTKFSFGKGLGILDFKKIEINNVLMYDCGEKHTFILTQNDELYCCGSNKRGQLGNFFSSNHKEIAFRKHKYMTNIISFACGSYHTFILTRDGLFSSGDNTHGQLGRTNCDMTYYFDIIDIKDTISFSCGHKSSLILTKSGLYNCQFMRSDDDILHSSISKIHIHGTKIITFKCGPSDESVIITKHNVYKLTHHKIDPPYLTLIPVIDEDLWSQKARLFY